MFPESFVVALAQVLSLKRIVLVGNPTDQTVQFFNHLALANDGYLGVQQLDAGEMLLLPPSTFEQSLVLDLDNSHENLNTQDKLFSPALHWLVNNETMSDPPTALRLDSNFYSFVIQRDGTITLQEWYRIKGTLHTNSLGSWTSENGFDQQMSGSRMSRRKYLHGTEVIIGTMLGGTKTWIHKTTDGTYKGMLPDLLNILKQEMNFTERYDESPDGKFGNCFKDGCTGVVGMGQRKEVDFILCNLKVTLARSQAISFLHAWRESK